jgi:hypothetical protein
MPRRATHEQRAVGTMVAPPEIPLEHEPRTALSPAPSTQVDAGPRHTLEEEPAATGPAPVSDALAAMREAHSRDQAERAERRQRLVLLISVPLFGLALTLGLLQYFLSGKQETVPTGSLWLTSRPEGASVKLNGKDVPGTTPLIVPGLVLFEANTVVVTQPGFRPWTKRFTPTGGAEPPMHAELEPLQPGDITPEQPPSPPPSPPPPETGTGVAQADPPPDTSAQAPENPPPAQTQEPGTPEQPTRAFYEVEYPTRLFVLRPAYNAFPVREYGTATLELNPAGSYSTWTEGTATLQSGRGGSTNVLAYFLEGDDIPADESFGLLSGAPRTIKGARKLHVFALDDDLRDNNGSVRIHLRQSKWVAPRELLFSATKDALVLKPEHQMVVRELNPEATYLFTVRDDYAELRPSPNGRVRQVLCAESGPRRRTHRLFEAGKRYQVSGVHTLWCAWPDTRVEGNVGALEVDVVDVTTLSRRERAAALRGAQR